MTLDDIIEKYGTHELDINVIKKDAETVCVYAYCQEHDGALTYFTNHYLKVIGKFIAIEKDLDDEDDIDIHVATIEKGEKGVYEIGGAGGYVKFTVEGDLVVEEITEEEYQKIF